jgi:hypothetical protein
VNKTLTAAGLMNTQWHHLALSVKRGGSANVYIDGKNVAVFSESEIGSLASGFFYFGAKYASDNTYSRHFAGYFDEIRIWNSALTLEGILLNKNSKLRGDEAGLQTYYPFETYTKQSSGLITVTPTDLSMTDGSTATGAAITSTTAMSVKDVRPVENVPFTYIASDRKIVFTLDPTYFARVEGTTLNITVKDVRDMRDNKSNVENWTAYVNRNALLWDSEPVSLTKEEGKALTFTAKIVNNGGATVSYAIEDLPAWLAVSSSAGNLQALASRELTFTVNQGVNLGNYEASIGLTSGNGVSDILPVQLKVTGERPDWSVNPADYEWSMNVVGQVQIDGIFQEDPDDLLAAFIGETCVGVTSPIYVDNKNAYYIFADIYGNAADNGELITFKLWDASTGRVYPEIATSLPDITFGPQLTLGVPTPVVFNAIDITEQVIPLKRGWTWISANVLNDDPEIFDQMKSSLGSAGVMIKNRDAFVVQPGWIGNLTDISETGLYLVNTNRAHSLVLKGRAAPANTAITLDRGWNWIGYIPSFTLPVQSALAGINAQDGDMIKAQSTFAVWSGNGWMGTLNYLQAGNGYMYYSSNAMAQTLVYPSENSQTFSMQLRSGPSVAPHWEVTDPGRFSSNMTFISVVFNSTEEVHSDELEIGAFSGSDCRGSIVLQYEGSLDRYMGFLTVHGEGSESITFKIYDHVTGEEYAASNAAVKFVTNEIFGMPDNPYIFRYNALYDLTVLSDGTGATASGRHAAGSTVNISAGTPPNGQQFSHWTSSPAVNFANVNGASTSFTMPVSAVTVTANFKPAIPTYGVSIGMFTGGSVSTDKHSAAENETVTLTISADVADGYEPDDISACKTGEPATKVTLNGTGDTRTFVMPGYGVTVTATFRETVARQDVKNAVYQIYNTAFTLPQVSAGSSSDLLSLLADMISELTGYTGIPVTESDITITDFRAATAGTLSAPSGKNGSFSFSVTFTKDGYSETVYRNGIIAATGWATETAYAITVGATTGGTVTASPTAATAGMTVTLTLTPAAGYETGAVTVTQTNGGTAVTVNPVTRTFTMPASDVTVTATFVKTQALLDREATEAAKTAIEGGMYRIAQATANGEADVRTWLVNALNVLFGQSHDIELRSGQPIPGTVTVTSVTPAIAGTEEVPEGINGSFTFTVALTRGTASLTTTATAGVIVATPHASTPVKRIELSSSGNLTVRIVNTGNTATGDLTLALSGTDALTLPFATLGSLAAGSETDVTLAPVAGLSAGTYTATLTVSGEGLAPVSATLTYAPTGTENPQSAKLYAVSTGRGLLIRGLVSGETFAVYNLYGQLVYTGKATGSEQLVPLNGRGVYVITAGSRRVKAVY